MTRRELVTAAIEHRVTPRVPYNIRPDGDMQGRLRQRLGWAEPQARSLGRLDLNDWLDNDVEMIAIPWWNWADLGPDWRGPYPPASRIKTIGTGSYISFYDDLKRLRSTPKCWARFSRTCWQVTIPKPKLRRGSKPEVFTLPAKLSIIWLTRALSLT